jgi:hypothetical protein
MDAKVCLYLSFSSPRLQHLFQFSYYAYKQFRESTLSTPGSRTSNPSSRQPLQASPTTLSERYSDLISKDKQATEQKDYVSLSDSDDGEQFEETGRTKLQLVNGEEDLVFIPKPAIEVLDDSSDDEFPELRLEARRRAAQQKLNQANVANISKDQKQMLDDNLDDIFEENPSDSKDPRIELFITSVMEGTVQMIIKRKMSQKLREVRSCWIDSQAKRIPIDASSRSMIFLTWGGKRLFDSTNCTSLKGLRVEDGKVYSSGEGVHNGRIHLEVWTPALFDDHQRKMAARANSGESEEEPQAVEEEPRIRVVVRAQGKEDLKFKVRASTTVQKIIGLFRERASIPDDVQIFLHFDGDSLDLEATMGDIDIEDMDVLEVHLQH